MVVVVVKVVGLQGGSWRAVIEYNREEVCLVPDPEETVPGAGGHSHAVFCHP